MHVLDIWAVTSRLQPVKSYRTSTKQVHIITGKDVLERTEQPEAMPLSLLADSLCLGKSDRGKQHNREKFGKMLQHVGVLQNKPGAGSGGMTSA